MPQTRLFSRRLALQAVTERNSTKSPLLNLPPEIRNMIWTHCLETHHHMRYHGEPGITDHTIIVGRKVVRNHARIHCKLSTSHHLTLFRLCHQIYEEIHDLFWHITTFHFVDTPSMALFLAQRPRDLRRRTPVQTVIANIQNLQICADGIIDLETPHVHLQVRTRNEFRAACKQLVKAPRYKRLEIVNCLTNESAKVEGLGGINTTFELCRLVDTMRWEAMESAREGILREKGDELGLEAMMEERRRVWRQRFAYSGYAYYIDIYENVGWGNSVRSVPMAGPRRIPHIREWQEQPQREDVEWY